MMIRLIEKVLVINIAFMFLLGCDNIAKIKSSSDIDSRQEWETEYKNVFFTRCLYKGMNKSNEVRSFLKKDRSTSSDFVLGLAEYGFIDSLTGPIIELARKDSVAYYHNYLEGMNIIEQAELNGLPILKYCLEYYSSNEFDEIIKKRVNNR